VRHANTAIFLFYCAFHATASVDQGLKWHDDNTTEAAPLYRSTQLCIPPGSLNRVLASSGWDKGGNVTSVGCLITLCDLVWHVRTGSMVRHVPRQQFHRSILMISASTRPTRATSARMLPGCRGCWATSPFSLPCALLNLSAGGLLRCSAARLSVCSVVH